MLRLGSNLFRMRVPRDDDILLSRLRLLVIIAKAYLIDYPFGIVSLRSIHRNSQHVAGLLANWYDVLSNINSGDDLNQKINIDHIFYQRIKLLAIMVKSFADGNPMGPYRKSALKNNIEYLSEILPHLQSIHKANLSIVK